MTALEQRIKTYIDRVQNNYKQDPEEPRMTWWDDAWYEQSNRGYQQIKAEFYADVKVISSIADWAKVDQFVTGWGKMDDYKAFDQIVKGVQVCKNA